MSGQTAVITALMAVVFLAVAAAMLTGGTGQPPPAPVHGRHRRNARRRQETDTPDVFERVLAETSVGMLLPFLTVVPDPEPVDALPFRPGPDYRDVDDWTADLPTEAFPGRLTLRVTETEIGRAIDEAFFGAAEPRRHTSPSETAAETARQRWGVECPIFAGLAAERGYDPVHGFEGRAAA